VLLILSQPGTKELRPETCADVINDSLKEAAETVAQGLSSAREQVSHSADLLVGQTQELSKIISALSTQAATVQVAGQSIPSSPMVILGTIAPMLEPPSLVTPTAPRSDLCSKIASYRETKNAVALVGDIACGKSQLALLAVAGIDKITWLAFRANEGIDPSALLDTAFQKCLEGSSEPESPSRALVIDDLEIGLKSRKFVDRLSLVARALRTQRVFLSVCSTRRLPSALQDQFATISIEGYRDDDIQALL
jgi:hypothetical protein